MVVSGHPPLQGQTEGSPPLDSVTPLHHFVVPLPLQGRNLQPLAANSIRTTRRRPAPRVVHFQKRSAFMTLVQAAAKSVTNFSFASSSA
ncbi:hypothetical protein GVN23_11810 [Sphingobium yanoikuyae]|nr:hypothetical protein [Sphingobium yanoikuyae]